MINAGNELTLAVVAAYQASRPAGLPAEVQIRPRMIQDEKTGPTMIVGVENGVWRHPKLFEGDLVIQLEASTSDLATADDLTAWGDAVESGILERMSDEVLLALDAKELRLTYIYPETVEDQPDEESGFSGERRWRIRLRTTRPILWSDGGQMLWSDGTTVEFKNHG